MRILFLTLLSLFFSCKSAHPPAKDISTPQVSQGTDTPSGTDSTTAYTDDNPVLYTGYGESIMNVTPDTQKAISAAANATDTETTASTDATPPAEAPGTDVSTAPDTNTGSSISTDDAMWIAGGSIAAVAAAAVITVATIKVVKGAREEPGGLLAYLTRLSPKTYFKIFKWKNEFQVARGAKTAFNTVSGGAQEGFKYRQAFMGDEIHMLDANGAVVKKFTFQGTEEEKAKLRQLNMHLGILPSDKIVDIIKTDSRYTYNALGRDLRVGNKVLVVSAVEGHEVGSVSSKLTKVQVDTPDNAPVPANLVFAGVDHIHMGLQEGASIYVHCKSGVGRSATLVAAWYMEHMGMSAKEAAEFIFERRPEVAINRVAKDGTPHYHLAALQDFEIALKIRDARRLLPGETVDGLYQKYKLKDASGKILDQKRVDNVELGVSWAPPENRQPFFPKEKTD